jgi:hypothetical protein
VLNTGTGIVSGILDTEMGESKYEIFDATLTMTRGDKTIESPFQIIYLDMSVITEEFTVEDYGSLIYDSNLTLQAGQCDKCTFFQSCPGASNVCVVCEGCAEKGRDLEFCLAPAEDCP